MQARTYTSLWRVERRIYRIYDVNLPYAVTVRQIGVFAAIVAVWIPIMLILRIPANSSLGFVAWVGPPILLAYLSNRPLAENKTLTELLLSEVKYRINGRVTHRLNRITSTIGQPRKVAVRLWTRHLPGIDLDGGSETKKRGKGLFPRQRRR